MNDRTETPGLKPKRDGRVRPSEIVLCGHTKCYWLHGNQCMFGKCKCKWHIPYKAQNDKLTDRRENNP